MVVEDDILQISIVSYLNSTAEAFALLQDIDRK